MFIELTYHYPKGRIIKKILINVSQINAFLPVIHYDHPDENNHTIVYTTKTSFVVEETYEEIKKLIGTEA